MSEKKTTPSYYAIIPAAVRYDPTLPGRAALLYGEITALAGAEGYCWASNGYFAGLYGVSDNTIRTWLAALEQAGHVSREDVRDPATNQILERRIWLKDAVKPPIENLPPPHENKGTPPHENEGENITSNNIPPMIPPKGERRAQLEEWFNILWKLFPQNRRKDRKKALAAFVKLDPDRELMKVMYRKLRRQVREDHDWLRGYGPRILTWINGRRWEDEIAAPPEGAAPADSGQVVHDQEVTYW